MLYIFHVDTGTTITFDMKLALESVSQLKEAIERECGVSAAQQVLLVSGGESLEPNARVCTYSAGTDTNPIYLFSKASIESHQPPIPSIDYGSDVDLQAQIESSLAMPATYSTVVTRAQLGQQCYALARGQTRICERLVHDQHLQQQGWAAVVANLEDITQMFQSRADLLQQSFTHYLAERQAHIELLNNFNEDLGMLSKIPILPALRAHAEGLLTPDDQETGDLSKTSEALSLLKWISAKDNQSSLEQVAEQCSRGLEQFDEKVMESLKSDVTTAIEAANKQDMKEIKGLGERLFGLEQLMFETKKLVQEQGDLAQAFLQNQNRASNLGDASILPDLCASHRRQLMVMLQNHNHLRDIRRRCTKAKEELSVNLYHRLKWIMYVENKMMEVDGKLVMYHESLKRLRRHLEVLQQIHLAPEMYMSAVAEVVRRRTFSQAFLVWASNLACQLLTVHSEELERRRDFQAKFDGHFLNTLFPGLEDTPPSFATQAPSVFDGSLPKLTSDDMESLRETLPDLALIVSSPDLNSITQFFLSRSLTEGSTDGSKDKEGEEGQESDRTCSKNMEKRRRAPLLGDRGGFESETDTEEFEKIGQAGADLKQLNSFDSSSRDKEKQSEVGPSQSVTSLSSSSSCPSSSQSSFNAQLSSSSPQQLRQQKQQQQQQELIKIITQSNNQNHNNVNSSSAFSSFTVTNHSSAYTNRKNIPLSPLAERPEFESHDQINSIKNNSDDYFLICSKNPVNHYRDESSSFDDPDDPNFNPDFHYLKNQNYSSRLNSNPITTCGGGGGGTGTGTGTLNGDVDSKSSGSTNSPEQFENGMIGHDFMGTEFYMDESLPSSLSEHLDVDQRHLAIVSLLQENLGNTREEVERLRSVLRCMKSFASEALFTFRQELASIKEKTTTDKNDLTDLTNGVKRALELHSRECERSLNEREQELTVDHELEITDLKKLMMIKEEEIRSLKDTILEKESERLEHERLIAALRLKIDNDQTEFRAFQSRIIDVEEALERANADKDLAVDKIREETSKKIFILEENVKRSENRERELEERLNASRIQHEEAIKNATDKFQKEYKTEIDNIRSRFKLMAASSMERSPSDSSLEKIERPDMIELVNHEAILSQLKEDINIEKDSAIRQAIEKERSECAAKLDHELRVARQRNDAERQIWFNEAMRRVIEEKERQVEVHRSRENLLSEECEKYKETIRRLTESENMVRQTLSETVESLEADIVRLGANMSVDRGALKEKDTKLRGLENDREKLIEELELKNEKLESMKIGTEKLKAELEIHRKNDDVQVSESKKFRLESEPDIQQVLRRVEVLETENKRLNNDNVSIRETKTILESKIEGLEAEKLHAQVELAKEKSRRNFNTEILSASVSNVHSNTEIRERDMSASVAVVPESSSRDAATSPEPSRRDTSTHNIRDKLTRSTANLIQQARISIATCNPGDVILVVWDTQHRNYILLQESNILYFLHSDCLDALDLRINPDGSPRRTYAVAEVVDKDYCHARKPENRYRVPQGTKFYRVKVKPQQKESISNSGASTSQIQMSTSSSQGASCSSQNQQQNQQQQQQPPPH